MNVNDEFLVWQDRIDRAIKKVLDKGIDYKELLAAGFAHVFISEKEEFGKRKFVLNGRISGIDAFEVLNESGDVTDFVVEIFLDLPKVPFGENRLKKLTISESYGTSLVFDPPLDHNNWGNALQFYTAVTSVSATTIIRQ